MCILDEPRLYHCERPLPQRVERVIFGLNLVCEGFEWFGEGKYEAYK